MVLNLPIQKFEIQEAEAPTIFDIKQLFKTIRNAFLSKSKIQTKRFRNSQT